MSKINFIRTSERVASEAAKLIKHPDPHIRSIAAVALVNRKRMS